MPAAPACDDAAMDPTPARRALARIAHQWGLARPAGGAAALGDAHVLLAALAALPVLWTVASLFAAQMRAPVGASAWLSFVVVQPLVEELVFRGAVQGELLQWTRGRRSGPFTRANVLASAAFAAAHLLVQPAAWALAVFVPSLVFGHVRDRLRSIWPAVFLHGFFNLAFALAATWARPGTP